MIDFSKIEKSNAEGNRQHKSKPDPWNSAAGFAVSYEANNNRN